jgi:hypothetical protein
MSSPRPVTFRPAGTQSVTAGFVAMSRRCPVSLIVRGCGSPRRGLRRGRQLPSRFLGTDISVSVHFVVGSMPLPLMSVRIPARVKVITEFRWKHCASLAAVSFKADSQPSRINDEAFASSSLRSSCLPLSVDLACRGGFLSYCDWSLAAFERCSKLSRIEDLAFGKFANLKSICIPASVLEFGASQGVR